MSPTTRPSSIPKIYSGVTKKKPFCERHGAAPKWSSALHPGRIVCSVTEHRSSRRE